jgi:acyl transferase domain-containing protein
LGKTIMNNGNTAALFAGQGIFRRGTLGASPLLDHIRDTFQEIDRVSVDRFGLSLSRDLLKNDLYEELGAAPPELIQLAVFGYSVAAYTCRENHGWRPAVIVGHGFGEIIGMVAGGAFSVREGAEIVCERAGALNKFARGSGSMIALAVDAERAESLVNTVGTHHASIAAENSETQTVVSGSHTALDGIVRIANASNIGVKRLAAAYPLHCEPLMRAAAEELAKRLEKLIGCAPGIPVYSPILGSYCKEIDSTGDTIAAHLMKPIRFLTAVRTLFAHGVNEFVECGTLSGLAQSAGHVSTGVTAAGGLAA